MYIWTSKALLAVALAACLGSAACVMPGSTPPASMTLANGGLVIAGPRGFCVDTGQSRESGSDAFVLLGSCASLARNPLVPRPFAPAVLTATVTAVDPDAPPLQRSFPQLKKFFASEAGRAALSRTADANSVEVAQTLVQDDLLLIELTDGALTEETTLQPRTWRGLMGIKDRIISFSVLGLADRPLSSATLRSLAEDFARTLRAANPAATL
jgi:hypothetical protein